MKASDLAKIIQTIKEGDNRPLKIIFERYSAYCIKPLLRKTDCSEDEAKDIFIEAVMNFREKILVGKVTKDTPVKSYMYQTCWNMWLKRSKKGRKFESVSDSERFFERYMYDEDIQEYDPIVSREILEEKELKHKNMLKASTQGLQELDEKCRKILTYFILDGLSMKEIAKRMGFANANVAKTSKSRCYKKWVKKVHQLYEGK